MNRSIKASLFAALTCLGSTAYSESFQAYFAVPLGASSKIVANQNDGNGKQILCWMKFESRLLNRTYSGMLDVYHPSSAQDRSYYAGETPYDRSDLEAQAAIAFGVEVVLPPEVDDVQKLAAYYKKYFGYEMPEGALPKLPERLTIQVLSERTKKAYEMICRSSQSFNYDEAVLAIVNSARGLTLSSEF